VTASNVVTNHNLDGVLRIMRTDKNHGLDDEVSVQADSDLAHGALAVDTAPRLSHPPIMLNAMTTDDDLRPTWTVQAVFEEDETYAFAYTIGLQDLGLPELHMTNFPNEGKDVGVDWHLSLHDLGTVLNQFGSQLMLGEVHVGDERDLPMDAGATSIRCRLDPPVAPETLEAWGAGPGTPVVPIRWSLHRTAQSWSCECGSTLC